MLTNDAFSSVSNCYVFKSRLQEYAQKVGLPTPVYETIKEGPSHEPSFRSTVIVNDIRYDSLPGFFNRKVAEQSAAEVALLQLSRSGEINQSISQPVHETGLCKNLLQEYAQKMNYAIPLYQCQKEEPPGRAPLFKCMVEIGGIRYIGASARTKKEAEIKAARTALLHIQSIASESHDKQIGKSEFVVIPCKKRGVETTSVPEENADVPKVKKARFKKKVLKKKFSGDKLDNSHGEVLGNLDVMDAQYKLEFDQLEGSVVEEAGSGPLALSTMGNFQAGRLVTDLNGRKTSDVKDVLTPRTSGGPERGQPAALDSVQRNHGSDSISAIESSGDVSEMMTGVGVNSNGDATKITGVGQVSSVAGGFTKINGVGEVSSVTDGSTIALVKAPNTLPGLNPVEERIEAGPSQVQDLVANR